MLCTKCNFGLFTCRATFFVTVSASPRCLVCGVKISGLNVRPGDLGVGVRLLEVRRVAGGGGARSTHDAGSGGVGVRRLNAVEPDHTAGGIVPLQKKPASALVTTEYSAGEREKGGTGTYDGENKNHAVGDGLGELGEAALVGEGVGVVVEDLLLVGAVLVGDGGVVCQAGDARRRVVDDLVVLLVLAADLGQLARGRAVVRDELRDHREGLAGVDGEVGPGPVEVGVALPERVVLAARLVADAAAAALAALAGVGARLARRRVVVAWVRSKLGGGAISLPQVHLVAAVSIAIQVCFRSTVRVDERRPRALGVAVARSVLGARGVGHVVEASVREHLGHVQRAVDPARDLRDVDVVGDLLVEQFEDVVRCIVVR